MSEYITINVEPYHIKNGSSGEADSCAIALALQDQFLDYPEIESIRVEDSCNIYKAWGEIEDRHENPLRVHDEDLEEVTNFIDWFDEQCDYDFLSEASEDTLKNHTLTFRVKELF